MGGMLAGLVPMDSRIEVVAMRMARMRIVVSTSGSMGSWLSGGWHLWVGAWG